MNWFKKPRGLHCFGCGFYVCRDPNQWRPYSLFVGWSRLPGVQGAFCWRHWLHLTWGGREGVSLVRV